MSVLSLHRASQPSNTHRRKVTRGFSTPLLRCRPFFFLVRRIQPSLSLVDREVKLLSTHEISVLHLLCMMRRKIPARVIAPRFELTSQRQKVSRLPTEPLGRPASEGFEVTTVVVIIKAWEIPDLLSHHAQQVENDYVVGTQNPISRSTRKRNDG